MSYPPLPPILIMVGGSLLTGWLNMNLTRHKKDMTGEFNCTVFMGSIPKVPLITGAKAGAPVQVYVGGHLAFVGTLDKRKGKGKSEGKKGGGPVGFHAGSGRSRSIGSGHGSGGGGITAHIGPNEYIITLKARGKTKRLIDSSHDHETGTITNAKTKPVVERLVKNFNVQLDWRAPVHDMDKIRFRDGATVKDEVHRVGNEYGLYSWETRDGRLRVSDEAGPETGEPLILGDNILQFEAEQSEDALNSEIKVKGQRTKKDIWGKEAVNREKRLRDPSVKDYAPLTVQHYTDASDEALDRRARFEANNRQSASRHVTIEVFHVQSRSGLPWDIGTLHYVEVPPEGVFDVMECISLTYTVDAEKRLTTRLTLAPPPASASSGAAGGLALGSLGGAAATALGALAGGVGGAGSAVASTVTNAVTVAAGSVAAAGTQAAAIAAIDIGAARMAQLGVKLVAGQFPDPWGVPRLVDVGLNEVTTIETSALAKATNIPIPLTLPSHVLDAIRNMASPIV